MYDPTQSRYRYIDFKKHGVQPRYIDSDKTEVDEPLDVNDVDAPVHGSYGALLFRTEWKTKRNEIIARDKQCVICNAENDLQVHHRQYHFIVRDHRFKNPWEYADNLLITLCESCHKRGHAKSTINL